MLVTSESSTTEMTENLKTQSLKTVPWGQNNQILNC